MNKLPGLDLSLLRYRDISRYVNTRPLLDQLEETMASTERLRVSRNRWPNGIGPRLISINLVENIAGHLRRRESLATTVASFASGNTCSGLENDREWSRSDFRAHSLLARASTPHLYYHLRFEKTMPPYK